MSKKFLLLMALVIIIIIVIFKPTTKEYAKAVSFGNINDNNISYANGKTLIATDTEDFINQIKDLCIEIGNRDGLYPSIMLAQAILESESGMSALSMNENNLFGIKGLYKNKIGNGTIYKTWEDNGEPGGKYIDAYFRKYPTFKESLEDYSDLLTKGLERDPMFYSTMWRDYSTRQEAINFLPGHYATDRLYANKINWIIEKYDLYYMDNEKKTNKFYKEKLKKEKKKILKERKKYEKLKKEELRKSITPIFVQKNNILKQYNLDNLIVKSN